ncbi:MAG: hypothetical protein GWP91_12985 [Rhodobacterales bacterium]|nr:hypothetical protein [Rhodobacterales bacterium]
MISVVTWNLDGLEERHLDVRMEAVALALVLDEPPDIIVFQEVVDRALVAHLRPHLAASGYMHAVQPATGDYYTAIFVRSPHRLTEVQVLPFPNSLYGRTLLEAHVQVKDVDWLVQTAHFDSGRDAGTVRKAQLKASLDRLSAHLGPGLFAGDTNLRDADIQNMPELDSFIDVWQHLGRPKTTASTWGPRQRSLPGRPQWTRFDRIFCTGLIPTSLRAMGTQQIPEADGMRPSDHIGLRAEFEAR